MKRLCTICARAGSKGVISKNTRMLLGKPLLAYSILQAKESGLFHAIAISSDSDEVLDIGMEWGADHKIKRPCHLATDYAPKLPVIRHCLMMAEAYSTHSYDTIVDLDVTSPLRWVSDIQSVIALLETKQVANVITGTPARRSPYFNLVEINQFGVVELSKPLATPVYRRQDAPKCYDLNASIYAWRRETLLQSETIFNDDSHLYVMPQERSVDIDTELDLEIIKLLMARSKENGL